MDAAKLVLFSLALFALSAASLSADPPSPAPLSSLSAASLPDDPPAPAPSVDCFAVQMGLAGCLDYVSKGTGVMKPSKDCCDGLKNALKSDPVAAGKCLCQGLEESPGYGIVLDMTHAVGLPKACNVTNYSVAEQCDLAPAPAPGSAAAPGRPAGVPPSVPTPSSTSGVPPSASSPPVTPSGDTAVPPNVAPSTPSTGASSKLMASIDLLFCTVIFAVFRTWFS